jgi:hypothetical protein
MPSAFTTVAPRNGSASAHPGFPAPFDSKLFPTTCSGGCEGNTMAKTTSVGKVVLAGGVPVLPKEDAMQARQQRRGEGPGDLRFQDLFDPGCGLPTACNGAAGIDGASIRGRGRP